jgi:hypothetical protein
VQLDQQVLLAPLSDQQVQQVPQDPQVLPAPLQVQQDHKVQQDQQEQSGLQDQQEQIFQQTLQL